MLLVLERHCRLGLDDRLELSACDEQLVEGCKYVALIVIKELHLADNALVARRLTFALSFLLSLSLLDLVKYPLATKQCILVDTLLEDKVWILDSLVFFFSWLFEDNRAHDVSSPRCAHGNPQQKLLDFGL